MSEPDDADLAERQALTVLVDTLLATERWEEVTIELERRLEDDLLGHDLLWKLGWACLKLGRAGDAAGYFQQAIAAGPPDPSYHASLGLALIQIDELDAAELWLLRALALRESRIAREGLVLLYERLGADDMAAAVRREPR